MSNDDRSKRLPHVEVIPGKHASERPPPYLEPLRALVASALTSLFAAYDLHVTPSDAPRASGGSTDCHAAFLGFTGTELRGALTLAVASALLDRTHPTGKGARLALPDAVDWCGELANQLGGFFKRSLLAAGHTVDLGVPQSIVADRLRLAQGTRGEVVLGAYTVDDFEVLLCLEVQTSRSDLTFTPVDDPGADPIMGGGDITFF